MLLPHLLTSYNLEDERTDEQPRSAYMSRKDVRIIAIFLVVLAVVLTPIYMNMKRDAERHLCINNFSAMGKALELYSMSNNDMYPPVYATAPDGSGAPLVENGRVYTWVSLIHGYMSVRNNFECPTSQPSEKVSNAVLDVETGKVKTVYSTYGMYVAVGGTPLSMIPRQSQTAILGETSNHGALDTYNPVPYKDAEGNVVPIDGFAIGWNTGNVQPTDETTATTRLAFYDTTSGNFGEETFGRHDRTINFLFADLHVEARKAVTAQTAVSVNNLTDPWAIPPSVSVTSAPPQGRSQTQTPSSPPAKSSP